VLHLPTPLGFQQQPQQGAWPDRAALARLGIVGGFITGGYTPGGLRSPNAITGAPPTFTGVSVGAEFVGFEASPSPFGSAGSFYRDAATTRIVYPTGSPNARSFSLLARIKATAGSIYCRSASDGTGTTLPLWRNGGFDMRINGTDYTAAGTWNLGQWYDIEIVGESGACQLFVDGALVINGGAAAAGTLDSTLAFGAVSGATLSTGELIASYILWANRPLSRTERAEFRRNPWQLFEQPQRIWVPVSAGGGATALVLADASHAHTADSVVLTTSTALSINDATHGHAAESIALSSSTGLTVADATHAHSADSPPLTTDSTLVAADALHAHGAENLTLSTGAVADLVVADASHAHAADGLDLSTSTAVAIADALHGHTAEGLALTVDSWLAANDATHAHSADSLDLSTEVGLTVADAEHAHTADALTLVVSGGTADAADVWAYVLSDGKTAGETLVENNRMLRIVLAALTGTTSGIGTETETYFGDDGTTPRLVATFDGVGNRVTVVTDGAP
jgi:hypothetical protein